MCKSHEKEIEHCPQDSESQRPDNYLPSFLSFYTPGSTYFWTLTASIIAILLAINIKKYGICIPNQRVCTNKNRIRNQKNEIFTTDILFLRLGIYFQVLLKLFTRIFVVEVLNLFFDIKETTRRWSVNLPSSLNIF